MKRFAVTFKTVNPHHLGLGTVLESLQGTVHVNAVTNRDAALKAETLIPECFGFRRFGMSVEVTGVTLSNNTDALPLNP